MATIIRAEEEVLPASSLQSVEMVPRRDLDDFPIFQIASSDQRLLSIWGGVTCRACQADKTPGLILLPDSPNSVQVCFNCIAKSLIAAIGKEAGERIVKEISERGERPKRMITP